MLNHYNQFVDYPRCRIYRQFVQSIINDRSIRTNGGSGLFYYTVLCTYTNFRTSYQRIGGIRYTVTPGQWVCTLTELRKMFRVSPYQNVNGKVFDKEKQQRGEYAITVVASSSKNGAFFEGAVGSTLMVDEIEIIWNNK